MRHRVLAIVMLLTTFLVHAETLKLTYVERPPYTFSEQGKASGILISAAQAIVDASGLSYEFLSRPTNRLMLELKEGGNICAVGWFKTPERELFANFSLPIYTNEALKNLFLKNRRTEFESYNTVSVLFSNRKLVVGVNANWSYGDYVDNLFKEMKPEMFKTVNNSEELIKRIVRHEIDYMFVVPEEIKEQVAAAQMPLEDFDTLALSDITEGNKRYFMCSKTVNEQVLQKLNEAIKKIVK